jgi:hypothetical protein
VEIRFAALLGGACAAGLLGLRLAAPGRPDLLAAAAAGAAFGAAASLAGYEIVLRAARRSPALAVQAFLAVIAAKVLAFAAFLLTVAFTTSLHPAALASGLAGATLVGEALLIEGMRRAPPGAAGGAASAPGPGGADRRGSGRHDE